MKNVNYDLTEVPYDLMVNCRNVCLRRRETMQKNRPKGGVTKFWDTL